MKKVRTFTLTFTLALMFVVSLLTSTGAAHAATRQTSSSSLTTTSIVHVATRQTSSSSLTNASSCGIVPLTFPFWTSSSPYGLVLIRPRDGVAFALAVTTTPDELRLGIGEMYVWIKLPGQNVFNFFENITINPRIPVFLSDFSVIMASFGQYTPEAVFNSCEWAARYVTIR